ncbi:MAG: phage tail tape measure protein [Rhizobiaceae bacterium]|nr:phage tail tape measure protein [Rhizobiaceae bacterium]MCV0405478.1 phage tail tape measure protein [Rhizobiaceae bacterium]
METDGATVTIEADTRPFEQALERLRGLSADFGGQLTGALRAATVSGRSLDDILRRIGMNLASMALSQGLAPLKSLTSSLFSGLFGSVLPFASGGVPGRVTPFANGGVVSQPTYFPMRGATGLMGEAGAEAIMPLARTSDGRLGVAAGGPAASVNVTFNVTTPDAASFRKSEAQVTGMLARAVSRGVRTL